MLIDGSGINNDQAANIYDDRAPGEGSGLNNDNNDDNSDDNLNNAYNANNNTNNTNNLSSAINLNNTNSISNANTISNVNNVSSIDNSETAVGDLSSKQRILYNAAALFATKGYTETTIRELAAAAGLKASSVYNHFESKNAILESMLADYVEHNSGAFFNETARQLLERNPTTDGIMSCLQTTFSGGDAAYYFNVLSMTLQEQHRNPVIREYIMNDIYKAERHTGIIIDILKSIGVIKFDIDPDYWMKLVSCVFYTFSNRAVLGNGDSSSGYSGMGMEDLLRRIFDNLLDECSVNAK